MKRGGATGSNAYGLGGLVPPAPVSPSGKFLSAAGEWDTPAGGGGAGYTNHTDLNFRRWTVSGHTDTPATLAAFDALGAAEALPVTTFAKTVLDGTGGDAVVPSYGQKVLGSSLAGTSTRILTSGTANWVYLGYTTRAITIDYLVIHVAGAGTGAQTAEFALASSPSAPNKSSQTLTKIWATGALGSLLVANSVCRNSVAAGQVVPAGVHLWAGLRVAMGGATQPTPTALMYDMGQGHVLQTAAAGALTGAGPWVGAVPSVAGTAATVTDIRAELA